MPADAFQPHLLRRLHGVGFDRVQLRPECIPNFGRDFELLARLNFLELVPMGYTPIPMRAKSP